MLYAKNLIGVISVCAGCRCRLGAKYRNSHTQPRNGFAGQPESNYANHRSTGCDNSSAGSDRHYAEHNNDAKPGYNIAGSQHARNSRGNAGHASNGRKCGERDRWNFGHDSDHHDYPDCCLAVHANQ